MNTSEDQSAQTRRELLVRYLEYLSTEKERAEVEVLLESSEETSREMREIRRLMTVLRENPRLFCPDPLQLSDYAETGEDPTGEISEHLRECVLCQEEVKSLKTSCDKDAMPAQLLQRVMRELPDRAGEVRATSRGWFVLVQEWLASTLRLRVLAAGAAAVALLIVLVFYPRPPVAPEIALSSVKWNDLGSKLPGAIPGMVPAEKQRVAMILLFKGFDKPFPQSTIDLLYKALRPKKEDLQRLDVLAPAQVREALTEAKVAAADVPGILLVLKSKLHLPEVVLVTVRLGKNRFTILSELVDTSSHKKLREITRVANNLTELGPTLRQAAYSVIPE